VLPAVCRSDQQVADEEAANFQLSRKIFFKK
jgi:hypothetical protein